MEFIIIKVFEAAVRWVRKDLNNRANDMEDLLRQCRLPLLLPQFLADRVAQEELVRNSLRCRLVIFIYLCSG